MASDPDEIAELKRKLDESQKLVRALIAGDTDTAADDGATTHILLRAAQATLRANEVLLQTVFDSTMDAILIADHDGRYVDANPAACELFGLAKQELIGRRIDDFRATSEAVPGAAWRAFLEIGQLRGDFLLRRADGELRDLEFSAVANVMPGLHLSVLRDVTARRRADAALHEAEARLRTVVSNAPIILFAFDRDGIYTLHDGNGVAAVGLRPGEIVGQSVFSRQAGLPGAEDIIRRALAGESAFGGFEVKGVAFDCSLVPVRDAQGVITGVTGVAVDVTTRNAAQVALRTSERRFRAMVEKGQDGISLLTAGAGTLYQSPAVERMLGYTLAEAKQMSWQDFVDPDQQPALHRTLTELMAAPGATAHLEFRIRHRDGKPRWLELTATNLLEDPDVGALVTNFRDISERKALERERDGFFEVSLELLCIAGMDGYFRRLNPAWERTLGWSRAELMAQPWLELVHPDDREATEREGAKLAGGNVTLEFANRYRTKQGTYRWLRWTCTPVVEEGLIFGTAHDITEQRRAREQQSLLASIVASSGDAIISRDLDGTIRSWNRGAEKLTQYTEAEAIGRPVAMLYPPGRRAELDGARARVDGGEILDQFELVAIRKDGSPVDISLSSSVLRTETGEIIGASIIARDISERRRAEAALRATEEQLRQAQKMEAIGSLAGGVAHDFNNLLTVILSYAEMMLDELKPADPLYADLEEIRRSGVRASVLTRQLLAFSRKQILEPTILDVNQVIIGVQRMLDRVLGEDIELSLLLSPEGGRVHADAGQLEQVLMNLIVNARDAMPSGGSLTIETSNVDLDTSYVEAHAGVTPGPFVLLAVTDTGTGMDRATQARIFEPFFTTKQVGKGTGLGLATVFGIVQQSGGQARSRSRREAVSRPFSSSRMMRRCG